MLWLPRYHTRQPRDGGVLVAPPGTTANTGLIGTNRLYATDSTVLGTAGGITNEFRHSGFKAFIGDGTDNVAYATPRTSVAITTQRYHTLVVVFRKQSTGVDQNTIAGYGSTGGGSGNTLFRVVGAATASQIQFQLQASDGSLAYNYTSSGKVSVNDLRFHTAVITIDTNNGGTSSIYIDGFQEATATCSVSVAATTFDRVSVCGLLRGGTGLAYGAFDVALFVPLFGKLNDSAARSISINPWQMFAPERWPVVPVELVGSYTLDAQSTSYSYTPIAASFATTISADVAGYAYSSSDTTLNTTLVSSTVGYTWTAEDATLTSSSGYTLLAESSDYAYSADNAGLNLSFSADGTALSLTANSAVFGVSLSANPVDYSYTANDATLIADVNFTIDAEPADYVYTASSADLIWSEATQRDAVVGKARKVKRFVVEIDGQDFIVDSVEAAIELLDQAKERSKEIDLAPVVKEAIRVRKGVEVKAPIIRSKTPDKRLQLAIKEARVDIQKLYQTIAENLELKIRLEMEIAERDDEESLAMLL